MSPLVVSGLGLASVRLVVIRLGIHGVVGLSVSGVLVGTIALLGPVFIVLGGGGGAILVGSFKVVRVVISVVVLAVTFTSGGLFAVRRGTVDVVSFAPRLSTVLVVVGVVPFIVRLGTVGFGVSLVVGDIFVVLLISAPGVEVLIIIVVLVLIVLSVMVLFLRSVLLGPTFIGSLSLLCVGLVVVGLSLNGVVRLSVSGVVSLSVRLLSPGILVVGVLGSAVVSRGSGLAVGVVALAVALAVAGGSGVAVGRCTVSVLALVPSLGAPLVVILVVPFVIGLSLVRLSVGLAIGLINVEFLVSAPSGLFSLLVGGLGVAS